MNTFNETNKNSKLLTVFAVIFSIAFTFIAFFTISNTANADYVEPYATGETYTLTGTYELKEDISLIPSSSLMAPFISNNENYIGIYFGAEFLYYIRDTGDTLVFDKNNQVWSDSAYRTLIFDNQDVSETFYNWIMENRYVEPQPPIIEQIIDLLVGGLNSIGSGVGVGLSTLASSIFLNEVGSLSTFGVLVIVFGGIALAIGLCRFVVKWLSKFGN